MLLYFAARAQNVAELVEPALRRGAIVLCDRWTDSTFAYQGFGRGLGTEIVDRLDEIACRGRKPDLTIWVDIDLGTSLARARTRERAGDGSESRFEAEAAAFFEQVRAGYQALERREAGRVKRVEGGGSVEEVYRRVRHAFDEAWGRTGRV
jgi:dTMP kinase